MGLNGGLSVGAAGAASVMSGTLGGGAVGLVAGLPFILDDEFTGCAVFELLQGHWLMYPLVAMESSSCLPSEL